MNQNDIRIHSLRSDRIWLWGAVALGCLLFGMVALSTAPTMLAGLLLSVCVVCLAAIGVVADTLLLRQHQRVVHNVMRLEGRPEGVATDGERRLRQELARLNQALTQALFTDELTGLHNRRAFQDFTRQYVDSPAFQHAPLSLVMMDVDGFKAVNDTYGHAAGDQLLKMLATRWRSMVRASDMLARIGGEEFCLVLPDTTLAQAAMVAENVRAATAERPIDLSLNHQTVPVCITVSLGVATADDSRETTVEDLVRLADQALYEAKHAGGDRVIKLREN